VHTLLNWMAARSLYVMASGVFVGYAFPELAEIAGPALPVSVAGMMVIGMLRIDRSDLFETLSRWQALAGLLLFIMVVSPLATWVVVGVLDVRPGLAVALVLTAACPPLMSTVSLAWMLGFNPPLALALVTVATLVCPAILAMVLMFFPDAGIDLDSLALLIRLSALISGCYLAATVLRWLLGPGRVERAASLWDVMTVCFLLVFAIAIMDGVAIRANAEPAFVAGLLAAAFAINLLLQCAGACVALPLGVSSALTVGFASGSRAAGIILAVAPGDATSDLVLFFALYQVPMYVLPSLLRPLYRWLLQRERRPPSTST
jgi:bile acid:Na+ symporter, BASS family